jgi:hypothetical protein
LPSAPWQETQLARKSVAPGYSCLPPIRFGAPSGQGAVLPAPHQDFDLPGTLTWMILRQGENFYRCAVSEPGIPSLLCRRRVSVN